MQSFPSTFTPAVRVVIDDLCKELTPQTQRTVTADYGQTDCGQVHDAVLCIESLPTDAEDHPGPLVSFLAGPGIPAGFVVLGADGAPVVENVALGHALKAQGWPRCAGIAGWSSRRRNKPSQGDDSMFGSE